MSGLVVGYLDDLIIVPLALLHLAFRWLPPAVREESLRKAERQARRVRLVLIGLGFCIAGDAGGDVFSRKERAFLYEVAEHFPPGRGKIPQLSPALLLLLKCKKKNHANLSPERS